MGGTNETVTPAAVSQAAAPQSVDLSSAQNPIRSHENQGEIHFHDETTKLKCAIPVATWTVEYDKWRSSMIDPLTVLGHDGKKGHSSVTLIPYLDANGAMQVATAVKKTTFGQTVTDMDKLAQYS